MPGSGSEITGGYDSGTLQPTFSVIAKNTNPQEKEHFLAVIRETLEGLVKNGLNKKSLLAGINSSEFRYREADFGHFPKDFYMGSSVWTAGFMMICVHSFIWRH